MACMENPYGNYSYLIKFQCTFTLCLGIFCFCFGFGFHYMYMVVVYMYEVLKLLHFINSNTLKVCVRKETTLKVCHSIGQKSVWIFLCVISLFLHEDNISSSPAYTGDYGNTSNYQRTRLHERWSLAD